MARRPSKQGLSTGILVVLLAGVLVSQALQAGATHSPANKAVANGSKLELVPPGNATPILAATMKTSKPQDLIFQVSLECTIITQLRNETGNSTSQSAVGRILVWVTVDDPTGEENIVPINSVGTGLPPNTSSEFGDATDKVTFCQTRRDQELDNSESSNDGQDTLRTYEKTKTGNAFNWVYLNAGSGIHTFRVFASLTKSPAQSCQDDSLGGPTVMTNCADGFVGNRTLYVAPERFANDADV